MRILVTAGRGLIGTSMRESSSLDLVGNSFYFHTRAQGDLKDSGTVKSILDTFSPDVIIHNASEMHGSFASQRVMNRCQEDNTRIFDNLRRFVTSSQEVYVLSSYHVFSGAAPFNLASWEGLNWGSSYSSERSKQIEDSRNLSNFKFVLLPHLFGAHDNFSKERSHFVANSIRRIVSAQLNEKPQIEFYGLQSRILQFATADQAVDFALKTSYDNHQKKVKYFAANIGWKKTCLQVFQDVCSIVGYLGLIVGAKPETKSEERDMYFSDEPDKQGPQELDYYSNLELVVNHYRNGGNVHGY